MARILIACEQSQAVCKEFRKLGHQAFSCDIQDQSGGHPEWHIQMDILDVIKGGAFPLGNSDFIIDEVIIYNWDCMIAFPPCTYLTVTANKWFKDQPPLKSGALIGEARREARNDAIEFFIKLATAPIHHIAIENPVGIMSTEYKIPTQIIQPYYFGDPYRKTTCLWLKNLPHLYHNKIPNLFDQTITHVDQGESAEWIDSKTGKTKRQPKWYAMAKHGKQLGDRSKERSKTFPSIAKAMATQWGEYLNTK